MTLFLLLAALASADPGSFSDDQRRRFEETMLTGTCAQARHVVGDLLDHKDHTRMSEDYRFACVTPYEQIEKDLPAAVAQGRAEEFSRQLHRRMGLTDDPDEYVKLNQLMVELGKRAPQHVHRTFWLFLAIGAAEDAESYWAVQAPHFYNDTGYAELVRIARTDPKSVMRLQFLTRQVTGHPKSVLEAARFWIKRYPHSINADRLLDRILEGKDHYGAAADEFLRLRNDRLYGIRESDPTPCQAQAAGLRALAPDTESFVSALPYPQELPGGRKLRVCGAFSRRTHDPLGIAFIVESGKRRAALGPALPLGSPWGGKPWEDDWDGAESHASTQALAAVADARGRVFLALRRVKQVSPGYETFPDTHIFTDVYALDEKPSLLRVFKGRYRAAEADVRHRLEVQDGEAAVIERDEDMVILRLSDSLRSMRFRGTERAYRLREGAFEAAGGSEFDEFGVISDAGYEAPRDPLLLDLTGDLYERPGAAPGRRLRLEKAKVLAPMSADGSCWLKVETLQGEKGVMAAGAAGQEMAQAELCGPPRVWDRR